MGIQEALFGVGTVVVLIALVYGVMRSKRPRNREAAANDATPAQLRSQLMLRSVLAARTPEHILRM